MIHEDVRKTLNEIREARLRRYCQESKILGTIPFDKLTDAGKRGLENSKGFERWLKKQDQ